MTTYLNPTVASPSIFQAEPSIVGTSMQSFYPSAESGSCLLWTSIKTWTWRRLFNQWPFQPYKEPGGARMEVILNLKCASRIIGKPWLAAGAKWSPVPMLPFPPRVPPPSNRYVQAVQASAD